MNRNRRTLTVANRPIEILAIDADPAALVWVAFLGTDEAAFVTRAEIAGL